VIVYVELALICNAELMLTSLQEINVDPQTLFRRAFFQHFGELIHQSKLRSLERDYLHNQAHTVPLVVIYPGSLNQLFLFWTHPLNSLFLDLFFFKKLLNEVRWTPVPFHAVVDQIMHHYWFPVRKLATDLRDLLTLKLGSLMMV